jgi:hypothetical protein
MVVVIDVTFVSLDKYKLVDGHDHQTENKILTKQDWAERISGVDIFKQQTPVALRAPTSFIRLRLHMLLPLNCKKVYSQNDYGLISLLKINFTKPPSRRGC